MTRRMERVNVLLRQQISRLIAVELSDPRLPSMVSVTRVETSPDLHYARVHVSVLGGDVEKTNTLKALKSAAGFMHQSLRRSLSLKAVPSLDFYLDESIEQGAEVLEIIKEAAQHGESRESVQG